MEDSKRFEVINSTANVDKRLVKLFELIENDLLAKIVHSSQNIAPYKVNQLFWYVFVRFQKTYPAAALPVMLIYAVSLAA